MARPKVARATIAVLIAITALGPMSMQIFVPALPAIQRGFGVDPGTAQLALSLSMVSIALATLIYGPLSDRYGRKPVLIVGLMLGAAGGALCMIAPNIELLIVGRIVQGGGAAAGMVLARAIVRDLFGSLHAAAVLAYLTMAMVVAPMVAPAIGGVLIDAIGWRANFGFAAAVTGAVIVAVLARLEESHTEPSLTAGPTAMARAFWRLLRLPMFRAYVFHGSMAMAMFFALVAAGPYVVIEVMDRPATEYGLYFILISLGFMLGNFLSARLSIGVGANRMIVLGGTVSLLGVLLAVCLVGGLGWWTPLALFLPTTVAALGNGLSMPNTQAGAISVEPSITGAASGLMGFVQMAIAALSAQLAGSLHDGSPYPMLAIMVITALAGLAGFAAVLVLGRRAGRS